MKCEYCNNRMTGRKRKFCSTEHQQLQYRKIHRESQSAYYKKWYQKNGRKNSEEWLKSHYEWRRKNREKYNASQLIIKRVARGQLKRPKRCSLCKGASKKVGGYHKDYNRPLEVNWLCVSCYRRVQHGWFNIPD